MLGKHSKPWYEALTALGLKPSASDELLTSTHWHLYVRLMTPGEDLFDTVLSYELGDDDPRVAGAYADAAKQAVHKLMAHLSKD